MTTPPQVRLALDRVLLEHPRALHVRRMRSALWLYLVLASRTTVESPDVSFDPAGIGQSMGLSEGTIRSWLGHLRNHGYVKLRRTGGSITATVCHGAAVSVRVESAPSTASRFFTVPKLEQALGETGYRESLQGALVTHADDAMQRALAGALAMPASEIRRSRTALFLFLLKRHAQATPTDDSRD